MDRDEILFYVFTVGLFLICLGVVVGALAAFGLVGGLVAGGASISFLAWLVAVVMV